MKISNKKAYFEFFILETLEAGIELSGFEVKSIKCGRILLEGSYVKILQDQAYLVGAVIPPFQTAPEGYDQQRTRRLLLHKRELTSIGSKIEQKKLTIVPISCYTKHGLIKLEIGLAKRKQEVDKREKIKKRDLDREARREFKDNH